MADKFTIEMHRENMRKIIRPQATGNPMLERLRLAARKPRPTKIRGAK